jgi:hypothetical protein
VERCGRGATVSRVLVEGRLPGRVPIGSGATRGRIRGDSRTGIGRLAAQNRATRGRIRRLACENASVPSVSGRPGARSPTGQGEPRRGCAAAISARRSRCSEGESGSATRAGSPPRPDRSSPPARLADGNGATRGARLGDSRAESGRLAGCRLVAGWRLGPGNGRLAGVRVRRAGGLPLFAVRPWQRLGPRASAPGRRALAPPPPRRPARDGSLRPTPGSTAAVRRPRG